MDLRASKWTALKSAVTGVKAGLKIMSTGGSEFFNSTLRHACIFIDAFIPMKDDPDHVSFRGHTRQKSDRRLEVSYDLKVLANPEGRRFTYTGNTRFTYHLEGVPELYPFDYYKIRFELRNDAYQALYHSWNISNTYYDYDVRYSKKSYYLTWNDPVVNVENRPVLRDEIRLDFEIEMSRKEESIRYPILVPIIMSFFILGTTVLLTDRRFLTARITSTIALFIFFFGFSGTIWSHLPLHEGFTAVELILLALVVSAAIFLVAGIIRNVIVSINGLLFDIAATILAIVIVFVLPTVTVEDGLSKSALSYFPIGTLLIILGLSLGTVINLAKEYLQNKAAVDNYVRNTIMRVIRIFRSKSHYVQLKLGEEASKMMLRMIAGFMLLITYQFSMSIVTSSIFPVLPASMYDLRALLYGFVSFAFSTIILTFTLRKWKWSLDDYGFSYGGIMLIIIIVGSASIFLLHAC